LIHFYKRLFSEKMLVQVAAVLVCCSCVLTSDLDTGLLGQYQDEPHDVLRREAEKRMETEPAKPDNQTNFFEIKDDATNEIVARMQLSQGAFLVNLVKMKNDTTTHVVNFEMDGRRVKSYGNYTFNKTEPTISAKKTVKQDEEAKTNSTKIDVTFTYTEQPLNDSSDFQVQTAEFKFTIEWGWLADVTRGDYWNLTSAGVTLTGKIGGSSSLTADLTPRFSYTGKAGDTACTTGYGTCAPVGLCWACSNQTLAPNLLTLEPDSVTPDKLTLQWIMPGLSLEPEWGDKANVSRKHFKFSAPWDCDPLLPLPVWVGLLISLFLASILLWAIQMLTALQTPNKWDDPKKPGIQVAQSE